MQLCRSELRRGQTNTLRTTRANLQEHLKPGSLDFTNRNLLLPDTIRDFMRLTARLGICYAWVDSLCVVQDGDDLQQQLNGMAAIFASANLTIISGGLSVNYGLIGTGNGGRAPEPTLLYAQTTRHGLRIQ